MSSDVCPAVFGLAVGVASLSSTASAGAGETTFPVQGRDVCSKIPRASLFERDILLVRIRDQAAAGTFRSSAAHCRTPVAHGVERRWRAKSPRLRPALALSGGKFTNTRKEHLVVSFSGGVFRLRLPRSSCAVTFLSAELSASERRYEMSRQRASAFVVDATLPTDVSLLQVRTRLPLWVPHVVSPARACRRLARQKICSEHGSVRPRRGAREENMTLCLERYAVVVTREKRLVQTRPAALFGHGALHCFCARDRASLCVLLASERFGSPRRCFRGL
ncbi:hypothetical protein MRX96_010510 [Rhipicephalus microplus]